MLKNFIIICALVGCFSHVTRADPVVVPLKSDPGLMGIGSLTKSNQVDYERFEGAFYLQWSPLSLAHTSVSTESGSYSSHFNSNRPGGVAIGVRHEINNFNHFSLFGDYGLGVNWMSGSFSARDFRVSDSSNTSDLLSLTLSPKLLLGYFISDTVQPFMGFGASVIYSRLESPLSGGSNEYLEVHYGPQIGVQVLNFPMKQLFFSADYSLSLNQAPSDSRLYADNGRAEIALGLTF